MHDFAHAVLHAVGCVDVRCAGLSYQWRMGWLRVPSYRRPATRCGASETSTGFANIVRFFICANLACPRRLIGRFDPTPNTTCHDTYPGLKLFLMTDVELRSGGKRRRCALQLRRRTKSMLGCWVLNPSAGHKHRKQDSVPRARLSSLLALDRLVILPPQPTCCSDRVSISVTIACRSMTVTLRPSPGAQGVLSIPDRVRDIISAAHA